MATDCLSEGINLQHLFTAVVHYDLAWNPTRHEQREGRVDRFGQQAAEVRCTMLWGQDNPVDGFVLNVILRKGETIQKELGVLVPMPEDEARINQALVKAALMKRSDSRQPCSGVVSTLVSQNASSRRCKPSGRTRWKKPRPIAPYLPSAVSVQMKCCPSGKSNKKRSAPKPMCNALCKAPVPASMPRWSPHASSISAFCRSTCLRPCASVWPMKVLVKPLLLNFNELHRSHPLVSVLAEHLLETSLAVDGQGVGGVNQRLAARCAATLTDAVEVVTTVYLLRLRHQLGYVRRRQPFQMMAEETVALAVAGRSNPKWLQGESVAQLLECTPSGNLPLEVVQREIRTALEFIAAHPQQLQTLGRATRRNAARRPPARA